MSCPIICIAPRGPHNRRLSIIVVRPGLDPRHSFAIAPAKNGHDCSFGGWPPFSEMTCSMNPTRPGRRSTARGQPRLDWQQKMQPKQS